MKGDTLYQEMCPLEFGVRWPGWSGSAFAYVRGGRRGKSLRMRNRLIRS